MWHSDPIIAAERPLHQCNYSDLNWVFTLTPATPDTAEPVLQEESWNGTFPAIVHGVYLCSSMFLAGCLLS